MDKYYVEYDLRDGYIHQWLYAGPQAISVENLDQFQGEDFKLQIARHYFQEGTLIDHEPVETVTFQLDGADLRWRAFRTLDDHFVDLSAFYHTTTYLRSWAFTGLLATGDQRGRDAALRTYAAVCKHMADTRNGGYFEIMQPDWQPERPGRYGGDRKSMDVHMHMMEALTTLYEMTGSATHRRRLEEVIDLIVLRMLHSVHGTGYVQFTPDFGPLPAIKFAVEWGRDADPEDGVSRPLETTSYGHNVEFIWLLLHAADVLGVERQRYGQVAKSICDHCVRYGIDRQFGGVFVEGPHDGPPVITEKQFWQQAEVLVGLLDAYAMFGGESYWEAFENVYRFVFEKFVNTAGGGEWFERLDREGRPIDDAMGHAWKISYHTVRSMIQTVRRLRRLAGQL